MKILKFMLLWITVTIVMLFTWTMGFLIGNAITQTNPPTVDDQGAAAISSLMVCIINSLLLSALFWSTQKYSGRLKWIALILYVFVIQFLLTQMETFFFSKSINITTDQVVSILIAGLFMSIITISLGMVVSNKMNRLKEKTSVTFVVVERLNLLLALILLVFLVYPMIYFTFGYYIAWQSESLRVYYTRSAELNSFFDQLGNAFSEGIYFFQILRGAIWVGATIPVIVMLRHAPVFQFLLVGLLSSVLPAILLLIPNPYMPEDIAMVHFVETSTSNFLWGIIITLAVNRYINSGEAQNMIHFR